MKKAFLIIISYTILAFAFCLGISSFLGHLPLLLNEHKSSYVFLRGLIYFFRIVPPVFCSAFLIGLAIHFGQDAEKAQMRFSPLIMAHFRGVMVLSIILVALMTVVSEVCIPLVQRKKSYEEAAPHLINEYIRLGEECIKSENYVLAHRYGSQILKIKSDSIEGKNLIDKSEAVLKAIKKITPQEKVSLTSDIHMAFEVNNETVTSLINKSKKAAEGKKWFESHYYAQLASSVGTNKDINIKEARRLASIAWNNIQNVQKGEKTKEQELFAKKRSAYKALSEGDNIEAYYQFMEIAEQEITWAADPDITQFLEIARNRVENQCFFIDETEKLQTFENFINVYFTIKHKSGVTDVVYIRGITPISNGGKMIQYLRGLTVTTFSKSGLFLKSYSVPYAKLLSVSIDDFDEEFREELELPKSVKRVPFILLESIDRNKRGMRIVPEYEFTDYIKPEQRKKLNYSILAISMDDFNTACDTSVGTDKMNIGSLMEISGKAEALGFFSEVMGAILIKRVTYPIIMMVILMFLATVAWNFRTYKEQLFKFIWIFIVPVCTIISDIFIQIILTVGNLSNYLLIAITGNSALLIACLIWTVLLFVVCVYFALRKSN